jgi:hypothetical protein
MTTQLAQFSMPVLRHPLTLMHPHSFQTQDHLYGQSSERHRALPTLQHRPWASTVIGGQSKIVLVATAFPMPEHRAEVIAACEAAITHVGGQAQRRS